MSLKCVPLTTANTAMAASPLMRGAPAVAINQTAGAITVFSSEDGGTTFDAGVSVPANGTLNVTLAGTMKASAAGVSLIGGL